MNVSVEFSGRKSRIFDKRSVWLKSRGDGASGGHDETGRPAVTGGTCQVTADETAEKGEQNITPLASRGNEHRLRP